MIQIKKCPRCGRLFDCYCQSQQYKCWCMNIKLSTEALAYLKKNYNNCLCPTCLLEISKMKFGNN